MNRVVLMGRLVRDPDVRYSQGENSMAIAHYTLAVDRKRGRASQQDGRQTSDFIGCVAFGKAAEFAEKYLHKGIKICVSGRIQTGSYQKRDGTKVYTTEVVCEDQEFAESKESSGAAAQHSIAQAPSGRVDATIAEADDFMNIPDGIDEELPFT